MQQVGIASYMPATEGFTMAAFSAKVVPVGTEIFLIDGERVGISTQLPGTGFTMATFNSFDIPENTPLFVK